MGSLHENNTGKRKSQIITGVIFCLGSTLALGLGGLAVWAGSQDNTQGKYRDLDTGEWDWWYVALHFIYPLTAWLLLFALFVGFRLLLSALFGRFRRQKQK